MCLTLFYDPALNYVILVGLSVMKGPFDNELEQSGYWPLKGTFSVEVLLTQYMFGSHYNHSLGILTFSHNDEYVFSCCAKRSFKDEVTFTLCKRFIAIDNYIAKESLFYHVSYKMP